MSIETATYIADLQPTNPPSSDPRGQGDDHLRLIKQVLQNSILSSSRAWAVPRTVAKSANYSILTTDQETTFYTTTSGGTVTYTLPSGLGASDSGWRCHFMKVSSDANPMFIVPFSGTLTSGSIAGLSSARRCIPGILITAIWSGTAWFISRALALPIGSMIAYDSATLPPGFEWPNGQTLSSSANYPEYNSAKGRLTTLDARGRAMATLDNLGGSAANRLTSAGSGLDGTVIGGGGSQTVTLARANLPNTSVTVTINDPGHSHGTNANAGASSTNAGGVFSTGGTSVASINSATTGITASFNLNGNVTQTGVVTLQPTLVCARILVVE